MNLSVLDRLLLMGLLPNEGDITTYRIVKQLKMDLGFSEQEAKDYNLEQVDGRVSWNAPDDPQKDVEIGPKAHGIIVAAMTKVSEAGGITQQNFATFDKFLPQETQE